MVDVKLNVKIVEQVVINSKYKLITIYIYIYIKYVYIMKRAREESYPILMTIHRDAIVPELEPTLNFICDHGNYKYECKYCKGYITSRCTHGYWKDMCKECGTGYCSDHSIIIHLCSKCGTGFCAHGKWKHQCKKCGIDFCTHGKRKGTCTKCMTGVCIHRNWKYRCKKCSPVFCTPEKRKTRCTECVHTKSRKTTVNIKKEEKA